MATSATKIALGVGCGILLGIAAVAGGCVACFGYGASKMAKEMEKQESAKAQLLLEEGWKFKMGEYSGEISGIVHNSSEKQFNSVMIEFNLYDSAGSQVGTATDSVSNLEPGSSWNFNARVYELKAESAKFKGFTAY